MKLSSLAVFIAMVASAPPRAFPQQELPSSRSETGYAYDCTKLPYSSAGCQSYDEMVAKADKGLLGLINGSHVFACFKPDEDVFFIVSLVEPYASEYTARSRTAPNELQSTGIFSYARFKNGVQDDTNTLTGLWKEVKLTNVATFSAKGEQNAAHAAADDTEISYGHSVRSPDNTYTVYALQIRRSTLRFSETYTASEAPPEGKPNKPPAHPQTKPQTQTASNGYCAEFSAHEGTH